MTIKTWYERMTECGDSHIVAMSGEIVDLRTVLAEHTAEIERLRADAERYSYKAIATQIQAYKAEIARLTEKLNVKVPTS